VNAACLRRTAATRAARILLHAAMPAAWAIGRARAAILRARWAWRCRGHPPITSERDPLNRDEMRAFLAAVRCWKYPAPPERSRT
jgi:hypothetical protein